MPQYVLSEADKNALARLLSKDGSAPPRPAAFAPPIRAAKGPDAMWALPPCRLGIPAATGKSVDTGNTGYSSPTNPLTRWEITKPGEAVCCLWHDVGRGLEPMLDPMGNPIRQIVCNYGHEDIQGLSQIYRHRDGKWVAEQPEALVTTTGNPASTSTTIPPSQCTGDCIFTADASLTWTGPTGGCQGTTTTAAPTTTSAPTTTATTTTATTTTTPSPAACVGKECRLVCVDTGTTPAPVDGIPPPYVRHKYELLTGYECDGDCGCYGLDDPCFLEDGEIVSQCLQGTTTTTPAPTVYTPCELAEILMGAPAPGESRFAALPGKPETWEACQTCDFGTFVQYGTLEKLEETIYNDVVLVAKQTCLKDPCQDATYGALALRQNATYYAAYNYTEQAFGSVPPEMIDLKTGAELLAAGLTGNYDPDATYYKPYWKKCLNCPKGQRDEDPEYQAGDYIRTITPQEFIDYGDENSDSYDPDFPVRFYTKTVELSIKCAPGPDCSFCSEFPVPPTTTPDPSVTTTTLTPTTTTSTTTPAPCSCPQPAFCPTVTGQCTKTVCQRGGSALPAPICGSTTTPAPNTCFDGLKWRTCPDCGYQGNSTTTTGTTTTGSPCSKPTINLICGANFVSGWWGVGANDVCCPGAQLDGDFGSGKYPLGVDPWNRLCGYRDAGVNYVVDCGTVVEFPCVTAGTTTTGTTRGPVTCAGGECQWRTNVQVGGTHGSGPYRWELYSGLCACSDGQISGTEVGAWLCCECVAPATPPAAICDIAYTNCTQPTGYQRCCCTPLEDCQSSCTWNSPSGSTWTKIIDPCAPTCPCPAPSRTPSSTCDTYTVRCDGGDATTSTSTTSTTTTTTAPVGACCVGGGCIADQTSAVCTSLGGIWTGSGSDCTSCQGACCLPPGGTCFTTFENGCAVTGGFVWGGIGTNCSPNPCPVGTTIAPTTTATTTSTTTTSTTTTAPPEGACCFPTGCFVSQAVHCGGTYMGDGTSCLDCSGACCQPTGSCSVSPANFCVAWGGTFGGYGTDCSPNPCPTTTTLTTSTPPTTLAPGP